MTAVGETGWWDELWRWVEGHAGLLTWLFFLSIASLVLCAILLPVVVVRLPDDYFATHRPAAVRPRTAWNWAWHVVKNVFGAVFVLSGVAKLFLPGQGLLTILIGLMLRDFPGKRARERRLVARPKVLAVLNRMRVRRGHAPLRID